MDALTDVLRTLRLSSTLFCRAEVTAPWSVHTRGMAAGIFHAVVRGQCFILLDSDRIPRPLRGGDLAFLPFGDAHVMCSDPKAPTRPIRELVRPAQDGELGLLQTGGGGAPTSILCGRFDFERAETHPLFSLLPRLLVVLAEEPATASFMQTTLSFMAAELSRGAPGVETVLTRLTDVLVVQALRAHVAALPPGTGGWLGGLRDPQIGRALGLLHREPREPWTADSMAARVGMSRSAFFARFTRLTGEPPAQYLTRWRMHLAAHALRTDGLSVAEVADRVGYGSEAAFSKAFKRWAGTAPGEYRSAAEAQRAQRR